jgi:predicted DCC family thiol-disulfide oxidoreductase YuxK
MLFDGDCGFCRRWIVRWQRRTGTHVDYRPLQDATIARHFPELPREQLETAVHLIATDGSVYFGAEAVFRSLASAGGSRWLLNWYLHSKLFARFTESCYCFVARHRGFFSAIS